MINIYYHDSDFYDESYCLPNDRDSNYPVNFLFTYSRNKSNRVTKQDVFTFLKTNPVFGRIKVETILIAEENYSNINDTHLHVYLELEQGLYIKNKFTFLEKLQIQGRNEKISCQYQEIDNRNPLVRQNIFGHLQKEDENVLTNLSSEVLLKAKICYQKTKEEKNYKEFNPLEEVDAKIEINNKQLEISTFNEDWIEKLEKQVNDKNILIFNILDIVPRINPEKFQQILKKSVLFISNLNELTIIKDKISKEKIICFDNIQLTTEKEIEFFQELAYNKILGHKATYYKDNLFFPYNKDQKFVFLMAKNVRNSRFKEIYSFFENSFTWDLCKDRVCFFNTQEGWTFKSLPIAPSTNETKSYVWLT